MWRAIKNNYRIQSTKKRFNRIVYKYKGYNKNN